MNAAISNTNVNTQQPAGVPPAPPEAPHQAGGGQAEGWDTVQRGDQSQDCLGAASEVVDDTMGEFFAPVSADLVDNLIGRYQDLRARIARLARTIDDDPGVVSYFLRGNTNDDRRRYHVPEVANLFAEQGAVGALNAEYWSQALALTDVYDCMPQARRDEWNKAIREHSTPDFEDATVRATLVELLASRQKFFAERVDGIFRGLSGEHVTNAPEAFGKRMIMSYVWSGVGQFMYLCNSKAGLINDLRCIVAKFMGRDEPKHNASDALLELLRRETGVWHSIDGGALRIRVYLKGTAHLEVHPDMAWRLNAVLASLYPLAIPSQFRQRPAKRQKSYTMLGRPLPFAVLALIPRPKVGSRVRDMRMDRHGVAAAVYDEAVRVVEALGGTVNEQGWCQFDYQADEVLQELHITGCIPDRVAHQYYPTPDKLARLAAEAADIGPDHHVLEPSAGQGHLAKFLPLERTTCVEIAPLHCAILKARGYQAVEADFLAWSRAGCRFDRIVMNPPFSEGRAQLHVEAAASMLGPEGKLVAILPASMRGRLRLAGLDLQWSGVFEREFAGTSANVAILTAQRVVS